MPINAAPLRGYSDWQRVSNYDLNTLYSDSALSIGILNIGPFDVSRYAYLAASDFVSALGAKVTINWYIDAAATQLIGFRQFTINSNLPRAYYRLANLGPFVKMSWNVLGGPSANHTSTIFATNRIHPLEFIPQSPYLVNQQTATLAAGVNIVYPTDYYAGPMQVWFQPTVGPVNVAVQVFSVVGTWDFVNQVLAVAANADITQTWIAPPGAWRLSLNNSGAGGTMFLATTPSLSGAA